jgi:hypothetical protein
MGDTILDPGNTVKGLVYLAAVPARRSGERGGDNAEVYPTIKR